MNSLIENQMLRFQLNLLLLVDLELEFLFGLKLEWQLV